ncbi:MAG TPA: caspase family protein [Pedobacter sp.]|uniref:caspase family protein n=1 Tax=Pedobacter sp. TaxID=1411316 RepID=UPI002CCA78B4|nr:caspase family protein [Pedobacter sp.]HMI01221.1 caspase family protein [Pedobacter sp.]
MKIFKVAFVVWISFNAISTSAQKVSDTHLSSEMGNFYGKAVIPPGKYKEAEALVQRAIEMLNIGEVNKADSLIDSSIKMYPTRTVFNYVREVFKMPDLNKALAIMEKLYEAVKLLPEAKVVMLEAFPSQPENGKMIQGIKEYEKERALFQFGSEAFFLNKGYGGVKGSKSILQKLMGVNIKNTGSETKYDYEYTLQRGFEVMLAAMMKEYDKAIMLVEQMPINKFSPQYAKYGYLVSVYLEKGEYQKALEIGEKHGGAALLFSINALLGNNEEALANYKILKDKKPFTPLNGFFHSLAIIDINKGDFNNALLNLDSALNYRLPSSMSYLAEMALADRTGVYKSIGDAYAGLQQFDKASDNYTISLLSNPEYQPAIDGLAKLKVRYISVVSEDKIPPVISLLEPSPKRGLKITSASANVMVKGIANDPSGIKEVLINGKKIYSQTGGDFWSDVALGNGLNKITIAAIDMADNKSEQVFEIEKLQPAVNTVQSEVIAVTEKVGRNYCLLVAAQNYTDTQIPSLENPIGDAIKLKLILKEKYSFEEAQIKTLFNPSSDDIKRQLLELTNTIQPEDNLLIFYAGHGIWVEKEKKGYWLMTDAKMNDVNTWLPNKDVLDLIAKLPSRHTLLITDACFSGSVFKTRGLKAGAPIALREMDAKISRVAITSGNDTEVPDVSVFMKHLVKALSENKEEYLTAQKMFITQIIEAVMTETKTEPRYGTLELAGHVGGDFIFTKK